MGYREQKCPNCVLGLLRCSWSDYGPGYEAFCLWCGFIECGRQDD